MTFLTRVDPASYGMDPLRRVMLEGAGLPAAALDRLSLTIGDYVLPIWLEALVLLAFGLVVLAFAVVNFRRRD
jgi:ABC-2 type transport system permease protein